MESLQVGSSPKENIPTSPVVSALHNPYPRRSLLKAFDPFTVDSPESQVKIRNDTIALDECQLKDDSDIAIAEVVGNRTEINKYQELNETHRKEDDILIRLSSGDVSSELNYKDLSDNQILEQRFAEQKESVEFRDRSIHFKFSRENGEIDISRDISSGELKQVESPSENRENTVGTNEKSENSSEILISAECLDIYSSGIGISDKTELANRSDIKFDNLTEAVVSSLECQDIPSKQSEVEISDEREHAISPDIKFKYTVEFHTSPGSPDTSSRQLEVVSLDEAKEVNDIKFNNIPESSTKLENNQQIDLPSTVLVEQVEGNRSALTQDQFSDQIVLVDQLTVQQSVEEQVNEVEGLHDIQKHLDGLYVQEYIDPVEDLGQINNEKIEKEKVEPVYQVIENTFHEVQEHLIEDISSLSENPVNQEALEENQLETNLKDTPVKQSIVVNPEKQEIESSTTAQSKMGDLNDTLNALQQENSELKLKLNASQQEKASLELEIRQKEEVIIKSQAEALKSEQLFKQELKQLKEQLKENSKFIENDSTKELQDQLKESKSREAKLFDELGEKKNWERVFEKFQSVFKTRINENVKLKEDLESAKTHLANLELAFSDLHSKYEKTKEALEGYRKHTAELLINLDACHLNSKQQEERYKSLKTYAMDQIDRANRENAAEKERFSNENAKLQAIIKRLEIKCGSLEVTLSQKTEECQALSALCDEVTGKKV